MLDCREEGKSGRAPDADWKALELQVRRWGHIIDGQDPLTRESGAHPRLLDAAGRSGEVAPILPAAPYLTSLAWQWGIA